MVWTAGIAGGRCVQAPGVSVYYYFFLSGSKGNPDRMLD